MKNWTYISDTDNINSESLTKRMPRVKPSQQFLIVALLAIALTSSCSLLSKSFLVNDVYCPIGSAGWYYVGLNSYLKLDESGNPEFIEVRKFDRVGSGIILHEVPEPYFRAYGADSLTMAPTFGGIQFKLYRNNSDSIPDTTFVIDVKVDDSYFEFSLDNQN